MITSKEIALYLNKNHFGKEVETHYFSQLSNIKQNTVVFAKKFSDSFVELLNQNKNILAIVTSEYEGKIECSYIISENPRLDFIKALSKFFVKEIPNKGKIHPTAVIEEGAQIGKNVTIGAHVYISSQTIIGDDTIIHANVVLDNTVEIGKNCEIKSGAVIGQSGFGFEKDATGKSTHFPHFGGVIIKNNVYVGSSTAIDRGTLGDTIINDNVKIDNLVHIAHNDYIDENSFIIAGASIGGGVHIGKNCWVAPNASIKEQTRIGDNALIGLGAVVLKNVDENSVVIGNPAKRLTKK